MSIAAGTQLGRYEVCASLGAGGMGEVYLAKDTQLRRSVALKVLPANFITDDSRLRRFEQEACAASALNHPNIITIYEIGQADSIRFIATEFIDGMTLRQQMARGRMELSEVLDVCIQVASALVAAHAAGIIHRDIKPENIMLRRDGYVKVLDFGLAKLTEKQSSASSSDAPTIQMVNTEPGVVMGTVVYMSPEQARGVDVDERTDIWSLGVVLYELLAGCAPFAGATVSDIIVSVLEREPPPVTQHLPEAPSEIQRIVRKALRKNREERYQTVKDLAIDLKNLRREVEVGTELEYSVPADSRSGATAARSESQATLKTVQDSAARPTTSVKYLVSEIKRHRTGALIALTVVLAAAIVFGLYKFADQNQSAIVPVKSPQAMKVTRLTTTGKAWNPAISPDGKYVVYEVIDGGQESLRLRHVPTGGDVQIVPPAKVTYGGKTFSPDGNYIYYVKQEDGNPIGVQYRVPVPGGDSKKLLSDIDSRVTFSPDGRLAFVRDHQGESDLMVANADGSGERKLAVRKYPESFNGPAWSPDGKVIACVISNVNGAAETLVEVRAEDGTSKPIGSQEWYDVDEIAWLSDGSALMMTATLDQKSDGQIWQLPYPEGEPLRVTNDLSEYSNMSLTADSNALVVGQYDWRSSVWIVPNADANRALQISAGRHASDFSWTPEGRIVYLSKASGSWETWIMDADGTNQKQLTDDPYDDSLPTVSHDGRYIVFSSKRTVNHIWRMDIDGSNPRQLTSGIGGTDLHVSPDSMWVVYSTDTSDALATYSVWKISMDGGEPVQLTDYRSHWPMVSPDGKLIAVSFSDGSAWKIGLIPFEGGQPIKTFDKPPNAEEPYRWSPDGRSLTYIDTRNGVSNIWSQPLDGSPPRQLTNFTTEQIFSFAWSRDGKQLICTRGTATNDIVLISDFR